MTACLLLPDVLAGKQHWEWCGQCHEAVKMTWCVFHLIQWALCDLVSCPAKTPMSSWMETALQMDFKNKYLVWLSKIQPVQKYKASILWMSTSYHCFSAEAERRCSAFLLEACYYSLVKVFSVLGIIFWRRVFQLWLCKGFWVLLSWGFGDDIGMALLFGCLFPVTFVVCRHQFQEETRGLIFTGDVWWNSCSLDGVSGRSLIVKSHFLKPGVRSTWLYLTKNHPKYSVSTSHEHFSSEHVFHTSLLMSLTRK